jgi:hypothetical protein
VLAEPFKVARAPSLASGWQALSLPMGLVACAAMASPGLHTVASSTPLVGEAMQEFEATHHTNNKGASDHSNTRHTTTQIHRQSGAEQS